MTMKVKRDSLIQELRRALYLIIWLWYVAVILISVCINEFRELGSIRPSTTRTRRRVRALTVSDPGLFLVLL